MIGRILAAIAFTALMVADAPVGAQPEKSVSRCERACKDCSNRKECVSKCTRCSASCRGTSVGYAFHCVRMCSKRTKQCWR
jgi:hypothetical protein